MCVSLLSETHSLFMYIVTPLALDSLSLADCYIACREGEYYKDGYTKIKLLPAVGVSLLSKTHSLFIIIIT